MGVGKPGSRWSRGRGKDINLLAAPQMREYEHIARELAADRPGRVLDWGCGHGQMSDLLRRAGIEVVAFDHRENVDRPGFRPLSRYPHIEAYVTSDPVALPFADDDFDSVLSCGVLEHVEHPDASLDELRRVLRPGGVLHVYKLPNRYSYLERLAKRLGMYYHGASAFDIVYDKRSAMALVERHGFTVTKFRRTNMLPLTVGSGAFTTRAAGAIWQANRALARIPGLNLAATNLELTARLA